MDSIEMQETGKAKLSQETKFENRPYTKFTFSALQLDLSAKSSHNVDIKNALSKSIGVCTGKAD